MRIETALKRRDIVKQKVRDMYSTARICGLPSTDMSETMQSLRANELKGTPQWVRSYIEGYERALNDQLYADALAFGGFVDGVFYSVHSNRDDYYGKHGIAPSDYADDGRVTARGHYYITPSAYAKPYFTSD